MLDEMTRTFVEEKIKLHEMKNEKNYVFSYDKNIANFEGFR